jgi:hypothetical protein
VNNADRLGSDPVMRWIVGGHAIEERTASASQMGRFETELLATDENCYNPRRSGAYLGNVG